MNIVDCNGTPREIGRRTGSGTGTYCVNCYQLPALREADRRTPEGKRHALQRAALLEAELAKETPPDLSRMQTLLRDHGSPSLCRHGGDGDLSHTEFSIIGLPRHNRLLVLSGYPCQGKYREITL